MMSFYILEDKIMTINSIYTNYPSLVMYYANIHENNLGNQIQTGPVAQKVLEISRPILK